MGGIVKHGLLQILRKVEISIVADEFVILTHGLGYDLSGRRHNNRMTEHTETILKSALGGFNQPGRIHECHRLRHDEMVMHS